MPPKKPTTNSTNTKKGTAAPKQNIRKATTTKASPANAKSPGKVLKKSSSKTKTSCPPKPSKETLAAIKIQKIIRAFLAKRKRLKKIKEKKDYELLIENLQKEAWLDIVRREQEEENKRREKEDSERRRKAQEKKWIKTFLEAAFDGELQDLKKILKEVEENIRNICSNDDPETLKRKIKRTRMKFIECEDANANSALSEASAGGDLETVTFLVENGANINSIGHFHRTPLYRAAFGGHVDSLKKILTNGGNPRIVDSDGVLPEQVAATPEIISILQEWDHSKTEEILLQIHEKEDQIKSQEEAFLKKEKKRIEDEIKDLETDHQNKQKVLQKSYAELNKRIYEHDECVAKGFERTDVTLQSIHDAEIDLARAQRNEEEARKKLFEAKLHLREQKVEGGEEDDVRIAKCNFKELDQVLMLDVGDVVKNSEKWPLILDSSNQAVTFLKYRDTNYLNLLNPKDVEHETLRKALLGAMRFGKSLVLDMLEVDMFNFLQARLNEIQDNLYLDLINKELVTSNRYLKLIRKEDGKEYQKENFNQSRLERFQVVIISKIFDPPEAWMDTFYTLRIITQAK